MSIFRTLKLLTPILALASFATPVQAGWDNVFQVACWNCGPRSSNTRSSYSVPAPQPSQHTTRYEEKEHYETITVMKPTLIREEVPVQVRSSYWDPVTTYEVRRYRDPQTGCTQDVSVPKTTMVRKESCNTVTKYVERMKMMPTEVRRKVVERTPVTTIVGPTTRSYSYECDNCGLPPASAQRAPEVEVIPGRSPSTDIERLPAQTIPTQGLPGSNMNRTAEKPVAPAAPNKPYTGKVNAHTTSSSGVVRGEVMGKDRSTPQSGAKVVFLNSKNFDDRVSVTTDEYGSFIAQLPPGKWHVYLGNNQGRADRMSEITITPYDSQPLTVVMK
ncbi:MAG: hypothetical protein ACRC8S_21100 [Fimbriiglobus sp.]